MHAGPLSTQQACVVRITSRVLSRIGRLGRTRLSLDRTAPPHQTPNSFLPTTTHKPSAEPDRPGFLIATWFSGSPIPPDSILNLHRLLCSIFCFHSLHTQILHNQHWVSRAPCLAIPRRTVAYRSSLLCCKLLATCISIPEILFPAFPVRAL